MAQKLVNNFYDWLLCCLKNDYSTVQKYKYQELFGEYKGLIEHFNNVTMSERISCLKFFNTSSIQKLTTVIECTKEEYSAINEEADSDLIHFNKLLGWYTYIISETKMFIEKTYENQEED